LILYGNTGVCRVMDITMRCFPGTKKRQLYYILKTVYQNITISTPIDNPKVFTRPIISRDEAERLIDMIPSIHVDVYHSRVLRELTEHYDAFIQTHNCADLIELTLSIYAKKQIYEQQKRRFGAVDKKFMKCAEGLLYGELAAALDIPKEKVPDYIAARVDGKGIKQTASP